MKSAAVILLLCLSGLTSFCQSLDPKYYVFGTLRDYTGGPRNLFSTNMENSTFEVSYRPSRWQYPEMKRTEEVTSLKYVPASWTEGCKYCDTICKLDVPPAWKLKEFYNCHEILTVETTSPTEGKVKVWNWKCDFREEKVLKSAKQEKLSYVAGVCNRLENVSRDSIILELLEAPSKMECMKKILLEFGCTILSYEQTKMKHFSIGNNLYVITFIPTEEIFNLLNEGIESKKRFANTR